MFLVIGIPTDLLHDIVTRIEEEHDGDFFGQGTFDWLCEELDKNPVVKRRKRDMLLTMYPDITSPQMSSKDPRKDSIDAPKIAVIPSLAFPDGYKPLYQKSRPPNQLMPMAIMPTDEPIFLQFLVFYESLDSFRTAKQLWKDVTEELDAHHAEPVLSDEDEADDSMMTASVDEDRASGFDESFDSTNKSSMLGTMGIPASLDDTNVLKANLDELESEADRMFGSTKTGGNQRVRMTTQDNAGAANWMGTAGLEPREETVCQSEGISPEFYSKIIGTFKKEPAENRIWIPKAICISSENPFMQFFSQILIDLWCRLFFDDVVSSQLEAHVDMSSRNRFLVEQFIKQLTHGTPSNFPGLTVHYKLSSSFVRSFGLFGKVS